MSFVIFRSRNVISLISFFESLAVVNDSVDRYLEAYVRDQSLAEKMIPTVGTMYRDKGVVITVFGRKLMNASTIDVIKAHRLGRSMIGKPMPLTQTTEVLDVMMKMDLGNSRIDIGKLAYQFEAYSNEDLSSFLEESLSGAIRDQSQSIKKSQDVVLYGFGRIGRILARLMIERTTSSNKLSLRAIVVRGGRDGDLEKRASLLRRDSVHGPFNGSIIVDQENSAIIANGNYIKVIYADQPEDIDYTEYGISNALVVDNTGVFKDEAGLSRHLTPQGASKVLLTAPAGGNIKNIVFGVNDHMMDKDDNIICAASCTTNAITPVLKVMNDLYGIENGHVETVHSYTNDQNLIDNYHTADRRGRSAPLNMVLTSTGAAKAVSKALPELKGKLTGNAIRVPTPNVSMAVINLNLSKPTTRDELNDQVRQISLDSPMSEQIDYSSSNEVVSSDFVGTPEPAIFDSVATIVEGRSCVLYVWYDNEFGYSTQVMRVMRQMVGLHIPRFPK
ncbi:MAG: glyceraldehyde-3-phosphate dehydrogenase [Gammaproteobacteria bacterium]|nr:glyceraldehyde-3-phosphate dehydrogenase [Gammaproteobacteria bacterium]